MSKKIKFNIPFFNKDHLKNKNILMNNSKFSGNNFFSKKCEYILSRKFNFKNVLLTDSSSSSFEIISTRLRNLRKKEVIIPSYSYPTVASSFIKNGFKVVLIDNQVDSPFINTLEYEKKITNNTACIVIVHHYGFYENIDFFIYLKKKYNLILVEDASQSINLKFKSKFVGSYGDFSSISFHDTKNIHCGLGGCLIVNNKNFLKETQYIWNRGTNRDITNKKFKNYSWYEIGSNYYPSEFQSIVLYNQLKSLNKIQKLRKTIFKLYIKNLSGIKTNYFKFVAQKKSNSHSIYLVCKNKEIRNSLKKFFSNLNIEVTSHYEPLHLSKFVKTNRKCFKIYDCKNAASFAKRILRLPFHIYLKKSDIERITMCLKKYKF